MSRKIGQAGIHLIKSFEGCRLTAYKPVPTEQYWTIGYGHYGPDVKQGSTITQAQADAMLVSDLARYEAYVNDPAFVPITEQLTQNQFDALVSFCYNCGPGNLRSLCKGRTAAEIAENMPAYNKGGGNVLAGLVRRRAVEVALFNEGDELDMEVVKELQGQIDTLLKTAEKHIEIINEQGERIQKLESLAKMDEVPSWAAAAVQEYAKTPTADGSGMLISDPNGGSYDFYRIVTIVKRILDAKGASC